MVYRKEKLHSEPEYSLVKLAEIVGTVTIGYSWRPSPQPSCLDNNIEDSYCTVVVDQPIHYSISLVV